MGPYSLFTKAGFQDSANQNGDLNHFPTYSMHLNSWQIPDKPTATLDYIMMKSKNNHKITVKSFVVKDFKTLESGVSFSDHAAVLTDFQVNTNFLQSNYRKFKEYHRNQRQSTAIARNEPEENTDRDNLISLFYAIVYGGRFLYFLQENSLIHNVVLG